MAIFEEFKIRRIYDEKTEVWYFSVIDVIHALTESVNPRDYWFKMKMESPDGKMRTTDTASAEVLLRIIQSIPSPKAEPFKSWLAKVGYKRMQEMVDPELSVNRARNNWQKHGNHWRIKQEKAL